MLCTPLYKPGPHQFFTSNCVPVLFLATWAVMSYPEIRALVLDASFDDLLPLALKVMPDSWSKWPDRLHFQCIEI